MNLQIHTRHSMQSTIHYAVFIIHFLHLFTLITIHYAQSTMHNTLCTKHYANFTMHSALCAKHLELCIVQNAQSSGHSEQSTSKEFIIFEA